MYVIAEVYESDIRRVHAGQAAVITGEMFGGQLTGSVERVGSMIARSQIIPTNPASFSDTRVVPVHILLTTLLFVTGTSRAQGVHNKNNNHKILTTSITKTSTTSFEIIVKNSSM